MRFFTPEAFAFAAALPVVVVFYLLKRKRVVKLVSSTLLWEKFLAETQASSPFQRLRHNWLMILQLLLLALVVLGLARPYFAGDTPPSRLRVMILDASASMGATDESPNRFELARREALKWVDGLRDNDRMVVLWSGPVTEVKQSATASKLALRRALEACTLTDGPTRLGEAFKLAETLVRDQADDEIHLFSDGAFPILDGFENRRLPVVYHRIGRRLDNRGLVSLDVRANPDNPAQRAIFASVANPGTNEVSANVELSFAGRSLETRLVTLPATNTQPLVFLADQDRDGAFTVRLTDADDLAADNAATIASLLPRTVNVLLVTRGNRFMEKALRAAPGARLTVAGQLLDDAPGFDVVVLDQVSPVVWPRCGVLAFGVMPTNWFEVTGRVEAPPLVDWRGTHPVLRYVSFDNVQVSEAVGVKTPGWGKALLDSPQTPLMVAGQRERRRVVWVGFDALQSTWPLRVSFPIFMANAVEWLDPANANAANLLVNPGDPLRLPLPRGVASVRVTGPDRVAHDLPTLQQSAEFTYGATLKRGLYQVLAGTNEYTFCVNLLDAAETDVRPRDELPFGLYDRVKAATVRQANLELWRWFALGGLLLLLFEWWFYHRRTA
jgi:hypothetical protein